MATAIAALGAGALAVATFVVPKLFGFTAGYVAVRSVSAATSRPQESIEASMQHAWASLEADPSMGLYYREFRTGFPDDYATFLDALTQRARVSTDKESDKRFGFEYMQSFVERNARSVAAASDELLEAHADQYVIVAHTLQEENIPQCAAFLMRGEMTDGFEPSARLRAQTGALSTLVLKAIKSGKILGRQRGELTDAQAQQFYEALVATGLDARLIDAFYDDTLSSVSLTDQCATGVAVVTARANLPSAESALWTALEFAQPVNEAAQ
jgi:hypothetical protein